MPRGGKRDGAGAPPLSENSPTEKHTVSATAEAWRFIEWLGDGNRSAGIRRLVELHQEAETVIEDIQYEG